MSEPGRLAQLGEHQLDKLGVTGSSPVPPTQSKVVEGVDKPKPPHLPRSPFRLHDTPHLERPSEAGIWASLRSHGAG
jgi:hypothetical protein